MEKEASQETSEQVEIKKPTKEELDAIIKNHVLASMGMGLIPIPITDLLGVLGIQLNLLRKLANVYNIGFSKDKGKNILASLVGSSFSVSFGNALGSLMKLIPVVGQTIGVIASPLTFGATTYAVAKVFIQHFESGGTFLTFNPEKVREYYQKMLNEGKDFVSSLKKSPSQN
ncbi:MAG: DUF697 domain-containing protein [Desulfobacterales bacterium]|nr:DUF697 domain-containing protein [Desulfobacterales bacterium]